MSPLATDLWKTVSDLISKVKSLKRFTWHNLGVILDFMTSLVETVEKGQEFVGVPGSQKKAVVIEVLESVIDSIDLKLIPLIPQSWVKTIFKKLLPILIDWVVALFNRTGIFKHSNG